MKWRRSNSKKKAKKIHGFAEMNPEKQKEVVYKGFKDIYSHWPLFCFIPMLKGDIYFK